ncbi:alpha/beta hydrolase [Chitinophaga horti]|uniref:Alpha/beta hydrolase n=1 Tax=Chitinophaga horti TaxID=2920382 RepID=A0ABY6J5U7_9BACT|nr:alpha/beta hydrolase [Chitinophaga horti]UYQ93671.1 alpha/beta hydrolase [Chitinophaga horti]
MTRQIANKTVKVNGIDIFYREAGDRSNPALLLLHGFPSSSVLFKSLMTALSDKYYLVAPDYPGFGFSEFPDQDRFDYTFDNIAAHMDGFTDAINLTSFTIYLHDYGCPIGLRICVNRPDKMERIIVQNGNAYEEGIGPQWDEIKAYWEHPTPEGKVKNYAFLSEDGVKTQYFAGTPDDHVANISPESWRLEWELMQRPGNMDMQYVLNCDFPSNFAMFPVFQEYFRQYQPPALVIWGKNEIYFSVEEAHCYQRDLPDVEVHLLDGGHMLLETHFDEVYTLIRDFLK